MTDLTPNIPFIRDQWIPALRDGTYQQGRRTLRAGDSFCCLGVAADLLIKSGLFSYSRWGLVSDDEDSLTSLGEERGILPTVMEDHIGLDFDQQQALIRLNDMKRKTFPEIADYIETHILAPALAVDGAE